MSTLADRSRPSPDLVATTLRAALAGFALVSACFPCGTPVAHAAGRAPAGTHEFRIDAGHSTVEFEIPFLYDHVRGRFDDVRGSVLLADPGERPRQSSAVMAVIRTASINTGSAHRDEHLRSSDFFDAGHDSLIVFRGRAVPTGARGFTVTGTLALHGHTRPIRVPCRLVLPPTRDPHHQVLAIATGTTTVSRRDFGIAGGDAHNPWFDRLRSATMGDSVRITLNVHLWAPDFEEPDSTSLAYVARIDQLGIDSVLTRLRAACARDSSRVAGPLFDLDGAGNVLLARGRVDEGARWLETVSELVPGSADAMVSAGVAAARRGNEARAADWFARALAADSLCTRAWVRRSATGGAAPR